MSMLVPLHSAFPATAQLTHTKLVARVRCTASVWLPNDLQSFPPFFSRPSHFLPSLSLSLAHAVSSAQLFISKQQRHSDFSCPRATPASTCEIFFPLDAHSLKHTDSRPSHSHLLAKNTVTCAALHTNHSISPLQGVCALRGTADAADWRVVKSWHLFRISPACALTLTALAFQNKVTAIIMLTNYYVNKPIYLSIYICLSIYKYIFRLMIWNDR